MSDIDVDVSELVAFAADLERAATAIVPATQKATESSARDIRTMSAARAPRRTGELAAGFEVEPDGDGWTVINRTRQAWFQEWGTSRHGPQPSLYPSADAVEPKFGDAIEQAAVEVLR